MSVRTDVVNLNVNINGDKAKNELNQLRTRAADLTFEMKGLTKGTVEYNTKAKELSQVNDRMASLRAEIGLTALTQKELTKELQKLNMIKANLTPGTEEFKNMQKQIDAVKSRLTEVRTGMSGFKKMWADIGAEVKGFGILAASYLGFEFITSGLHNIISGAGKTSDSLAQLSIYMHGSAADAQELYNQLRKLDTRTSNADLLDIATIVAKKGVAKQEIAGVTQALDQLFVVLGKEIGDPHEAVASLVKLVNVYSDDHHVTAKNISDIGAAIQGLTSSGVATGGFLISFAERMAGLHGITGITIQSVLGMGAALEELGQRSESASTAAQKLILQMFLKPQDYAKAAGLSIKEFSALLAKDPVEALIKVAATLKQTGKAPEDLINSFTEMGVNGARVIGVLGDIAGNADYMRKRFADAGVQMGNTAATAQNFAIKNETLGATLDKIGKKLATGFTASGLLSFLKSAAIGFAELIGAIDHSSDALDKFHAQKKYVDDLEKSVTPLIDDYDRLAKKANELGGITKLSTGEQDLMKRAIQGIAASIPRAITQFDEYGKAIGISTDQARQFLNLQKLVLREKNRDAIKENEGTTAKLQQQLKEQQALLNQGLDYKKKNPSEYDISLLPSYMQNEPVVIRSIAKANAEWNDQMLKGQVIVGELEARLAGLKGIKAELTGEPLINITGDGKSKPNDADTTQQNTDRTIAAIKADLKRVKKELETASADKRAAFLAEQQKLKDELAHAEGKETPDEKKAEAAEKKAAAAAARREKAGEKAMETSAEKLKKFQQELIQAHDDLEAAEQSADDKKVQAITDKYRKIIEAIDRELHDKKGNLLVKMGDYAALVAGFGQQQIDEINLLFRKSNESRGKQGVQDFSNSIQQTHDEADDANNNRIKNAEEAQAKAPKGSLAELDAHKELLIAKFRSDVGYYEQTTAAYKDAQAKLNKDLKAADKEFLKEKIQQVGEVLQGLSNLFSSYANLQNQKDENQLNREKAQNDEKKTSYEQQLKKKLISQTQYDAAIAGLDADMDKRQKEIAAQQAKRTKAAALFSAIINAALGITNIWGQNAGNPYYAAALTAIEVAATGIQIATIEQQDVPTARKGLVIGGPSHEAGGIGMYDNNTGKQLAEIEGGEPVMVLSKNTYANNKPVIDELIHNSQNLNGAAIRASSWYGAAGPQINTSRVIPLMRSGGTVGGSSPVAGAASGGAALEQTNALMQQLIDEQRQTREAIAGHNTNLKAYIVRQDLTDYDNLVAKAKSVAGINQAA